MSNDFPSLLPNNATEMMRISEQLWAREFEAAQFDLRTLWSPTECPAHLLPWLAWALSVDEWDDQWPEAVQRQVIAVSMPTHMVKGTRGALEDALAALGVNIEIEEWFDAVPMAEPGTMRLTAWINQNLTPNEPSILVPRLYEMIRRSVQSVKRASLHFDFRIGAGLSETLGVAGLVSAVQKVDVTLSLFTQPIATRATVAGAGVAAAAQVVNVTMEGL